MLRNSSPWRQSEVSVLAVAAQGVPAGAVDPESNSTRVTDVHVRWWTLEDGLLLGNADATWSIRQAA
ncbi:MAG: hypothetical protein HZB26_15080 [Candidatus Hydrogenedentes bacterium]|nr:hypothetical protein [Candidatus Hydrogenedentota bacterium]